MPFALEHEMGQTVSEDSISRQAKRWWELELAPSLTIFNLYFIFVLFSFKIFSETRFYCIQTFDGILKYLIFSSRWSNMLGFGCMRVFSYRCFCSFLFIVVFVWVVCLFVGVATPFLSTDVLWVVESPVGEWRIPAASHAEGGICRWHSVYALCTEVVFSTLSFCSMCRICLFFNGFVPDLLTLPIACFQQA